MIYAVKLTCLLQSVYLTELVEQRSRLNDVSYKLIATLALAYCTDGLAGELDMVYCVTV